MKTCCRTWNEQLCEEGCEKRVVGGARGLPFGSTQKGPSNICFIPRFDGVRNGVRNGVDFFVAVFLGRKHVLLSHVAKTIFHTIRHTILHTIFHTVFDTISESRISH